VLLFPRGESFATEIGEQRLVRLDDGTRVHLNTATQLTVYLSDDRRRVALTQGQAFFDVAPDRTRPFLVETGNAEVEAVGTRFDVRLNSGATEVILVEGKVDVEAHGDAQNKAEQRLVAGQRIIARAGRLSPISRADTAILTAWTEGRLQFANTPLAEAVAEVNRYTETPLVLAAPAFADDRVNGGFAVGDTDAFVRAVTALYPLRAVKQPGGGIRLTH
jgi:transmembrane sensor